MANIAEAQQGEVKCLCDISAFVPKAEAHRQDDDVGKCHKATPRAE